jgi:SAM-dependent methyltransferase
MTSRKRKPAPAAFSRSAALYDLLYAEKPYAREAEYISALLASHGVKPGGRLLDLACGTGRHLLEWERLGFVVAGADASADMLDVARANAKARRSKATFHHRAFAQVEELPGGQDAVVCMFSAVNYLLPPDTLAALFGRIRTRLRRGGLLVLDHWNGFAVLAQSEATRVVKKAVGDTTVLRIARSRTQTMEQRVEVAYNYMVLRGDVVEQDFEERHQLAFHFPNEMRRAFVEAGFKVEAELPFLEAARAPTAQDFHITVVGRAV